jgi:anti-anti-sigma regulatory factor
VDPIEPDAVRLPATLDVETVAAAHAALTARADAALVVDLGAVEQVDLAGLQLLCALVRTAAHHQRPLAWRGASRALHVAANTLGLGHVLGLPEAP